MCEHSHHDHAKDENSYESYSLYQQINLNHTNWYDGDVVHSAQFLFRAWHQRMDLSKILEASPNISSVLVTIPFLTSVKLSHIIIMGPDTDKHPNKIKLYKNRQGMSDENVGYYIPDQEFNLGRDPNGMHQYPLKVVKFTNTNHLSLYFPSNFNGSGSTSIYYIGLKGTAVQPQRSQIVLANYEIAPKPSKKIIGEDAMSYIS